MYRVLYLTHVTTFVVHLFIEGLVGFYDAWQVTKHSFKLSRSERKSTNARITIYQW